MSAQIGLVSKDILDQEAGEPLLTTVMTVEQALKAAEMEPKQGAKEDTEGVMLNFFHEEKSPEC